MLLHERTTEQIIAAFYEVYNTLGYGFLENVYEKAFMHELELRGIECKRQQRIKVFYKGVEVGDYYTDLMVQDCIILELKAASALIQEHEYQLMNYLKATNIELGFCSILA